MMATFAELPEREVTLHLLTRAHELGDGLDAGVAAHLAVADSWTSVEIGPSSTRKAAEAAVAASRTAGDPVCESTACSTPWPPPRGTRVSWPSRPASAGTGPRCSP